jgi:predicted Zn-dependent protease
MNPQQRRQMLEEMLAESPDDNELRYALAMEEVSAGDLEAAVRRFRELASLGPDKSHVPAFLMAGQILQKLGRAGEAIAILRDGVEAAQKQNNMHALGEMQGMLDMLE